MLVERQAKVFAHGFFDLAKTSNVAALFHVVLSGVLPHYRFSDVLCLRFPHKVLLCPEKRGKHFDGETCPILDTVKRETCPILDTAKRPAVFGR